jgi:hypothetical protein
LQIRVFDASHSPPQDIVEPVDILSHAVAHERPHGTYGITSKILVVCRALQRGR